MPVQDDLTEVGPRLRAVRLSKGWTLTDLAERVGMSVSTLSRLEAGKRQANLELLVPIVRQLGVSLDNLVAPSSPDPRVRRQVIKRNGLVIAPLAPEGSEVRTYKITYPPRTATPELRVHDGYEWLYVLSGRLRLRLGSRDIIITPGESAEFDTSIPHSISATGSEPAQIISIFNDDGVRMHTHLASETDDSPH